MILHAADEGGAVQEEDFLSKKRLVKRSRGCSAGKRNVNYSETELLKLKPTSFATYAITTAFLSNASAACRAEKERPSPATSVIY